MSSSPAAAADAETKPAGPPKGPLLLALANTLAILAALGALVYTRLLYKRPAITESSERARLEASRKTAPAPAMTPGLIPFDPLTANIEPVPPQLQGTPGTAEGRIQGKLHYCTLGFSLEVRDIGRSEAIDRIKPVLIDRLLSMLGRKAYYELSTVQGRYLLRQQIVGLVNDLLAERKEAPLATDVFFTQFVVQ
jgi:flagellar basal body-associated protein FliL